jgi:hypothetical protein
MYRQAYNKGGFHMAINSERDIIFSINDYNESSQVKQIRVTKENEESKEIEKAIDELEGIRQYFNIVEAPELIEYAIYREKAALARLSYLIRQAKEERSEVSKG